MSIQKINIQKISVIFFVFLIFCGAFFNIISRFTGGIGWYAIIVFSLVNFVMSDKNYKNMKIEKNLLWFFIFSVFYIVLLQLSPESTYTSLFGFEMKNQIVSLIQSLLIVVISIGISKSQKYDNQVQRVFIMSFFINVVFTQIALMINPNISKIMATGNSSQYTSMDTFGVVGYGYVYAIIFLIPIIVVMLFEIKKQTKIKIILFCFLFYIIYFIFHTGYFTATILALVMILFFMFLITDVRFKIVVGIPIMLLGYLLFDPNFIINQLFKISNSINVFSISERINQIAYYLQTGNKGDTLLRIDLYMESINSFIQHPIVGNALLEE